METLPGADAVLVRYGDIGTKSAPVQRMMEDRLAENLRATFARSGVTAQVEQEWSRPIIHATPAEIEAATEAASMTMGVVSASPAKRVDPTLEAIVDTAAEVAASADGWHTFAVRARRGDKRYSFTSNDIEIAAGDAIFDRVAPNRDIAVDLDDPELTVSVEVRSSAAFVFLGRVDGPGGLPVGSQAPLVALVSGGIDSPVAAYRAMRRGSPVVPVYVDLGPYGGPDHQARALEAIATLQRYAGAARLPTYVVPAGPAVERFVDDVERGRMLVLRRFMFRLADAVADDVGAVGIVTGEALGQKSSQTASNLTATSVASVRPIHRPLLTSDKREIIDTAQAIGTYRSAAIDAGCPSVVPDAVETQATIETIDRLEPDDVDALVATAFAQAERLEPQTVAEYIDLPAPT